MSGKGKRVNRGDMFFELGDIVRWTSQAAAYTRTKQGEVIRVLGEQEVPYETIRNPGLGRDHQSYLVRASIIDGTDAQKKRTRIYWPKVKYLDFVRRSTKASK